MSFFKEFFVRPRRRDLSQLHNSGNEDGGLENVGKPEATRSESAT